LTESVSVSGHFAESVSGSRPFLNPDPDLESSRDHDFYDKKLKDFSFENNLIINRRILLLTPPPPKEKDAQTLEALQRAL
jgi:hypothetical protein